MLPIKKYRGDSPVNMNTIISRLPRRHPVVTREKNANVKNNNSDTGSLDSWTTDHKTLHADFYKPDKYFSGKISRRHINRNGKSTKTQRHSSTNDNNM